MTTTTTTKKKTTTRRKTTPQKVVELPPNPFIFEILDLANSQRTKDKRIETLQKYENDALKTILIWNFDETVISMLPEGPVPYGEINDQNVYSGDLSDNLSKEASGGESATGQDLDGRGKVSLRREYQNLYHFVKGGNDRLTTIRREMMFINLLQGLHPKEAEILILTKDKKLQEKYSKITFDAVKESYSDIQWGGRS
jgi:hypothetical protein